MDRRQFLVGALTAAAAAATVRFAITSASAAPQPDDGGPEDGLGDMVHRTADGWESHMLPFAKPFPTLGDLQSELMQSRAMGLFR